MQVDTLMVLDSAEAVQEFLKTQVCGCTRVWHAAMGTPCRPHFDSNM